MSSGTRAHGGNGKVGAEAAGGRVSQLASAAWNALTTTNAVHIGRASALPVQLQAAQPTLCPRLHPPPTHLYKLGAPEVEQELGVVAELRPELERVGVVFAVVTKAAARSGGQWHRVGSKRLVAPE